MRKLILALCLGALAAAGARAQTCAPQSDACEPPPTQTPACIVPEVGAAGEIDEAYEQIFYLNFGRTAQTGVQFLPEVYLSRLEIISIDSLPPGLEVVMFSSNPEDAIHGGATGSLTPVETGDALYACGVIHGTPEAATTEEDSIVIVANAFVKAIIGDEIQDQEIDPNTILPGFNPIRFRYKVPVSETVSRAKLAEEHGGLRASPNPAAGRVRFSWETPAAAAILTVRNAAGQIARRQAAQGAETELDLEGWPAGVYMAELVSDGKRQTARFIVAR